MKPEDIDQLLESGRYKHLSEETLVSYRDNQLNTIRVALADAHLHLCLVCEQRLASLKEEAEAAANYVITEEDHAAIQQTVREMKAESNSPGLISTEIQRLTSYVRDLLNAWVVPFSKAPTRGAGDGDEIWRYESEDGRLTAWAVLEKNASLTVHFSSPELAWEGARILFRLGPFSKEVALQRKDSGVAAKIEIPRRERAKNMADISIKVMNLSAGREDL